MLYLDPSVLEDFIQAVLIEPHDHLAARNDHGHTCLAGDPHHLLETVFIGCHVDLFIADFLVPKPGLRLVAPGARGRRVYGDFPGTDLKNRLLPGGSCPGTLVFRVPDNGLGNIHFPFRGIPGDVNDALLIDPSVKGCGIGKGCGCRNTQGGREDEGHGEEGFSHSEYSFVMSAPTGLEDLPGPVPYYYRSKLWISLIRPAFKR